MSYFNNYPYQYMSLFPQQYPQYQVPQQTQQGQQTQQTPQIQNGGFVPVPDIDTARNWHVNLGTSVTFIDENAPYVYTKTRGFSQLEPPVFEKLRLVKEEDIKPQKTQGQPESNQAVKPIPDAIKADYEALRGLYEDLRKDVDRLKAEWEGKDDEQ